MTDTPEDPPAGPENGEDAMAAVAQEIAMQLQGLLGVFAPEFPVEEFAGLVEGITKEQLTIGAEILPSIMDPEAVKKLPRFGVRLFPIVDGKPVEKPLVGLSPKRIEAGGNPVDALQTALTLAFLMSPAIRALLRVKGFHYDFIQAKAAEPKSLIHRVKH